MKEFLNEIIDLNNWFIAHQLSCYTRAGERTKKHLDELYLEFNRRWKGLLTNIPKTKLIINTAQTILAYPISAFLLFNIDFIFLFVLILLSLRL